jgi:hypothetical protein
MQMKEIVIERVGQVVISTWPEEIDVDTTNRYFDQAAKLLERREPLVFVLDARATSRASSAVREAAGKRLKEQRAARQAFLRGEATVLSSALIRGTLTALYFVAPPGYPTKVFSDLDAARSWAESRILR